MKTSSFARGVYFNNYYNEIGFPNHCGVYFIFSLPRMIKECHGTFFFFTKYRKRIYFYIKFVKS